MAEKGQFPHVSMYPLLWLAVSFAAGIAVAERFAFASWPALACGIAAGLSAAIFRRKAFAATLICAAFVSLGALTFQITDSNVKPDRIRRLYDEGRFVSGDSVEIEGVISGAPEPAYTGYFLNLTTEKLYTGDSATPASGNVRLFVQNGISGDGANGARLDLGRGSRIRAACRLEREERYLNPGVRSRVRALDQQDIDAIAMVKSPLLIEKLSIEDTNLLITDIVEARRQLVEVFRRLFSTSTAGILIASLLGNKHLLDKSTADVFREGGTFHILVISGLHITFIGGLIVIVVRLFTRRRLWLFLVPVLCLWTYTLAVGADIPVVRASLMFTVLLFSQLIYRKGTLLNAFGFCGLVLLAWRPNDLFNPSFQLTFVSVAAIVSCAFPLIERLRAIGNWTPTARAPFPPNVPRWLKRFCEMVYWNEEAWRIESGREVWSANLFKSPYLKPLGAGGLQAFLVFVFEGIVVSLIVQLWMLPLLVWYFHRVSVASVILNLWTGLLIALESFTGLGAVLLAQIGDVPALPLVRLTEFFNSLLLWLPRLFSDHDSASFRVPVYSDGWAVIYLAYFVPVVMLAISLNKWDPFALRRRSRLYVFSGAAGAAAAALAVSIVFHPWSSPGADGRLTVDFLDVGQGDAALVTFPDGKTMLVDGGGTFDYREEDDLFEPDIPNVGEAVVSEFLWEKGYSKIDYLVATHADSDHMQGLVDVAENFEVGTAYFGRSAAGNRVYDRLVSVLEKKGIRKQLLSAGEIFQIAGVHIEVLSPGAETTGSDNNSSVVLRLVYGRRVFLLTGDIEAAAETELLQSPGKLKADIVKVPHHGSRTSSTQRFVDAADPQIAVFSVGKRSIFGHPHPEIVERWKNCGAEVITTGSTGAITVSTDGIDLNYKRFDFQE